MEAVATRAGVGKATLYRRWSSKPSLVVAAVDHMAQLVASEVAAGTTTSSGGLESIVQSTASFYRGPSGRALLGLVVEMWRSPHLSEAVRSRFIEPRREALRRAVREDVESRALRGGADLELALDMIIGAVLYRALVSGDPLEPVGATRLAQVLRDGIAEQSAGTPSSGRCRRRGPVPRR
jgi:AcrR family transcriptional regulator